jgi:hypothetical protein
MADTRSRLVLLAAAVPLLTAACVSPRDPGVAADSLKADIVFGVEEPAAKEAPLAPVGTALEGPYDVAIEPLQTLRTLPQGEFRNRIPARFQNVPTGASGVTTNASACPRAPLGSAPERAAPDRPPANTPPKEGAYRYKISGKRTQVFSNGARIESEVSGFQPRVVRNIEQTAESRWTYETVQPYGDGGIQVMSWVVNANPAHVQRATPYVGENAYRVSEPEGGLSVQRITYYNGSGNLEGTFDPAPPIVWAPFPVVPGQEFTSVGVSPRSRQSQRIEGEPTARQSVDACGELIDGWLVEHDVVDSSGGAYEQDVVVSTDMGGLVISQRLVRTFTVGDVTVEEDITFSLGQVVPDPLPSADNS